MESLLAINCLNRLLMKITIYSVISLAVLMLAAGCVNQQPVGQPMANSNLTAGQVSLTLKKNVTTQAEVVETFGAPNIVTANGDGEEIWTYQKNATVSSGSSSSGYATIILAGTSSSNSGFEQSSRTMTLIIKFKEVKGVKVVSDFSSRSSSF
jgi:hypothetical protein